MAASDLSGRVRAAPVMTAKMAIMLIVHELESENERGEPFGNSGFIRKC